MTCDDFLKAWNTRIDDPGSFAVEDAQTLDNHSTSCEGCRRLASGFRSLSLRLPPPSVPEGLSDRVLNAWAAADRRDRRIRVPGRWAWAAGLAAAAALLLAIFTPWTLRPGRDMGLVLKPTPTKVRNLSSALARVTSATLDLARETSAPAARLGFDVYDASLPGEIVWPGGIESGSAPSELFQSVSREVNSRVVPLSGSARRAFSFLIAPGAGAAAKEPAKDDAGA